MLAFTLIAMVWANSPWAESYFGLWQTMLTFGFGDFVLSKSLLMWISDGLMAVFFFVVGLEIKREVLVGELSSFRDAALPLCAALGGMVVPAAMYLSFNAGTGDPSGWGIPMANDIAFALGVLALIGDRVPVQLKIFLTALAIVDDIGAVLVIAIFYTADLSLLSLGAGALLLLAMFGANRAGARHPLVYLIIGLAMWVAFLKSGIHATVAGVLAAMAIPARSRIDAGEFLNRGRSLFDEFQRSSDSAPGDFLSEDQQSAIATLEKACENVATPLQRLEHALHPWVIFAIMPVFALANAGVPLSGNLSESVTAPVSLGIIAGLVAGKQAGVTLFSWLAVKIGLATLPPGIKWIHIYGAGLLSGIGFTMSLFIAGLALSPGSGMTEARIAILLGSSISGIAGWLILRRAITGKN